MNDTKQAVAENLNAYLDGELDADAAARLELRLAADPRLARHLRELQRVRDLTRRALADGAPAGVPITRRRRVPRLVPYALAAGLLVGFGVAVDRLLTPPPQPVDELSAYLPPGAQVIQPAHLEVATPAGETRALFHIADDDPRSIHATLGHIEHLLKHYAEANRPLQIELIVNADGLTALRADLSPAREEIARLQHNYANVEFVACGTTIARVQRETGREVRLLPHIRVASSALDQILVRLQQGWSYVRI